MVVGRVDAVVVEGAGGVAAPLNGLYRQNGTFFDKPKFKLEGAAAIIYFLGRVEGLGFRV